MLLQTNNFKTELIKQSSFAVSFVIILSLCCFNSVAFLNWPPLSDRRHTMAHVTFIVGEKVLCYEPDPGKVNKLYPAVVKQVIILM